MPEASILITAQDRYSSAVKAMSSVTKSFNKDQEAMEQTMLRLTRNQNSLRSEFDASKKKLKELEKQYAATGDEAVKLEADSERLKMDNIKRNLDLVTRGAREAQRQMEKTGDAFSRASDKSVRAGNGFSDVIKNISENGMADVIKSLGAAGFGQMIGQAAQQGVNTIASSALGSNAGSLVSSTISSAISGAAIGSLVPVIGPVIGALAGGAIGVLSGGTQIYQNRDEAFKSYVQEQTEGVLEQRSSDIQSGSTIAAGRETNLVSFSTLFGNKSIAESYLSDLVGMANTTPFLYDDLVTMSKTLATYGYNAGNILPTLRKIGDAGAALGMTTSDMSMVATALGRMKSSDKATLEYLNILNDRGIGAVSMLAEAKGMSVGETYTAISKGEIKGGEAVDIILAALEKSYAGSMKTQSETYSGKSSTLEGLQQELQNAYGEGYNAERKKGIQSEIDWLSGASGSAQEEANKAIGAWQASLENAKEGYIRAAVDAAMESAEYQLAKEEGDAATMGRIIAQAKVQGNSEYLANEGKDQELADQIALADAIRTSPDTLAAYEQAGYTMGQVFSKGMASAIQQSGAFDSPTFYDDPIYYSDPVSGFSVDPSGNIVSSYAVGLNRVPYDGFPAILHEGERVLTAREARQADAGGGVTVNISGNTFEVRQESDIDAIAQAIAEEIELRRRGGAY